MPNFFVLVYMSQGYCYVAGKLLYFTLECEDSDDLNWFAWYVNDGIVYDNDKDIREGILMIPAKVLTISWNPIPNWRKNWC